VEVWLLTTLAADRLRADNRAAEALGHALDAARQEGVRRPFLVVDTERLPRLLTRLEQVDPGATGFVDELLADMGMVRSQGALADAPAEALTDRELSVVRYLPTMMTNAEIASELFVSVNTVKAHLKRIYTKLGVTSRRQAVHRAHALGLLNG
jgi:LuxR family maltose regulon positive regulatory protein